MHLRKKKPAAGDESPAAVANRPPASYTKNKTGNTMTYDGRAVANFILDSCQQQQRGVTNLALQKIVYFCHAWSLTAFERPLIRHNFEAWQHGPVLQYLYREFKVFDSRPITARATRIDPASGKKVVVTYDFDDATRHLLVPVIEFYSRLSPFDLVDMTHAPGGPWHKVWHHGGSINPGMKIDDRDIATFYSRIQPPFVAQ